jgi:molybdate transport system ATP-binding protein
MLVVYGPSGAGKTTLLRLLAGLLRPDTGFIEVEGETWLDTARRFELPTRRRSIGFVFQDFALFPHLTVRQQLEYALQDRGNKAIVSELLTLMELEELQHLRPALLSGGQQQRVALARAIARRPRLLLLDEPLSALDDDMRNKLQDYILMAHHHYGLTTLLVSHHLPEVLRLADEAVLLEEGKIIGQGAPSTIFAANVLTGTIIAIEGSGDGCTVRIQSTQGISSLTVSAAEAAVWQVGQSVSLSISPRNPAP